MYYAAEMGIRTAEVMHGPKGWDIRCYYGPKDYDATVRSRREDAERVALAHSLAVIR